MNERPRQFQECARRTLQEGQSCLIFAPTGLGKTRSALFPFISNNHQKYPHLSTRLIYALPMRALTQGVRQELKDLLKTPDTFPTVAVHHGEKQESRTLIESACITTVDQYFTAFAGAPLSFAINSGHAVAGALLTSYSVFDEVHLLSPSGGLPLLFAILKLRQRWGLLSCVMTATLPDSVKEYLRNNLSLKIIEASKDDIAQRDNWRKVHLKFFEKDFNVIEEILQKTNSGRIILFANTVDRAISYYLELKKNVNNFPLYLIHSRFTPQDRENKQEQIARVFRKGSTEKGILVTTQVCEAGMNISAPVVFSELAPADALIQRAGRCCRFKEDHVSNGEFIVFESSAGASESKERKIENKEHNQKKANNKVNHLPYPRDIWDRTKKVLQEHRQTELNWENEKKLINDTLGDCYDAYIRGENLQKRLKKERTKPLAKKNSTPKASTRGLPLNEAIGIFERAFRKSAPKLVEHQLREMLNVQVIVARDKQTFESDLLQNQSFPPQITLPFYVFSSKYRNARFSVYRIDLQMLKEVRRHKANFNPGEGAVFYSDLLVPCHSDWEIKPGHTYVIISDSTGYSSEIGLTFGEDDHTPTWTLKTTGSKEPLETTSRDQTFEEHARAVSERSKQILKIYHPFIKKWASRILEGVNADDFSEYLCTAIQISALYHDVGKLSSGWQHSAGWQAAQPFIARTQNVRADKRTVLPKHAPYAYPFIKTLLRNYFQVTGSAEGRILDHIALASAKHHNIEVMGNIQRDEFQPADDTEVLQVLKCLAEQEFGEELARHIPSAYSALKGETKADEPPGPSEDFYFLYCIAHRAIKMADWEDAGNETLELMTIRQP